MWDIESRLCEEPVSPTNVMWCAFTQISTDLTIITNIQGWWVWKAFLLSVHVCVCVLNSCGLLRRQTPLPEDCGELKPNLRMICSQFNSDLLFREKKLVLFHSLTHPLTQADRIILRSISFPIHFLHCSHCVTAQSFLCPQIPRT